jgi:hypothetical protein
MKRIQTTFLRSDYHDFRNVVSIGRLDKSLFPSIADHAYRLKSSIFIKAEDLWISGSTPQARSSEKSPDGK